MPECKPVRILVTGGRDFRDFKLLTEGADRLLSKLPDAKPYFYFGDAKGADSLIWQYVLRNKLNYERFVANWKMYGKAAGMIRNKEMLDSVVGLEGLKYCLAFWDGKSKGTHNMITLCSSAGFLLDIIKY